MDAGAVSCGVSSMEGLGIARPARPIVGGMRRCIMETYSLLLYRLVGCRFVGLEKSKPCERRALI